MSGEHAYARTSVLLSEKYRIRDENSFLNLGMCSSRKYVGYDLSVLEGLRISEFFDITSS